MKISTRTRYGLRLMVYLGAKYSTGPIHLNNIANQEKISEKYLEQIVPYLKSAKLITSIRGNAGGYQLSMPPEMIPLIEIISSLEGDINLVDCQKKSKDGCELNGVCAVNEMWAGLSHIINKYLSTKILSDLVEIYNNKHNINNVLMYYI